MMSLAQITLPDMKNFQNLLPMVDHWLLQVLQQQPCNAFMTGPDGQALQRLCWEVSSGSRVLEPSAWALMKTLLERAFLALICCQHYAR